jgi:hypothetical protein
MEWVKAEKSEGDLREKICRKDKDNVAVVHAE